MSGTPDSRKDEHEVATIYGDSPGSEPAALRGTSGHEVPPVDDTPTIYHVPDEERPGGH